MVAKILTLYGYTPSIVASGIFLAIFSISTILHAYLVGRTRIYWLSIIVVGGFCEIIGWGGRTYSYKFPANLNGFLVQQICLILGPTFFSAFCYLVAGMTINAVGSQHSRMKPNYYLAVFSICDLIAIVVQAAGGGLAAIALIKELPSSNGTHIMVAGIVFQLVSMVVFCILILDFYVKARKDPIYRDKTGEDQSKIKRLVAGIFIGSTLILIRCIYRTAELAQGWTGYLITHEAYFIGLDSVPMALTMIVFLYAHPSWCLPTYRKSSVTSSMARFNKHDEEYEEKRRIGSIDSLNSVGESSDREMGSTSTGIRNGEVSSGHRVPVPGVSPKTTTEVRLPEVTI